ncbi:uncharacterized protein PHALS_08224 [Plasmopara halstedii]|uniref:Uncharacterized protein n=1 Tax=Plasmopara halstedii TaxID=4781 RepID=A0A0P1ACP8_PLAHL|nr:uncharacterized protein PHALS_08224 [Plasmopara halstedii]CEG38133.1 hypothetical protein PHALS_08224 [Plasmopara halstedii]|eukprot:XP_024574502.1 hypothetical protein PHALS_08224 [Plasmopara halstedii]
MATLYEINDKIKRALNLHENNAFASALTARCIHGIDTFSRCSRLIESAKLLYKITRQSVCL